MQKVKFAYDTPMIGDFINEGPELSEQEIIKAIEADYPEAYAIEIIDVEVVNG